MAKEIEVRITGEVGKRDEIKPQGEGLTLE